MPADYFMHEWYPNNNDKQIKHAFQGTISPIDIRYFDVGI
jgi:hypothetical protein